MANALRHTVLAHVAVSIQTARVVVLALILALGGPGMVSAAGESIRCPLADGFDHAVGKPDAHGYYRFRGFNPKGHLGEDWDGNGGGNTDLGDPVYAVAVGVVVHAADLRSSWGNVVIVRHAFRDESGKIQMVDSLYAHLNEIKVRMNQIVKRGELLGTIGTNHGMYVAHLHLEMHRNLAMGPSRVGFARDYSNFYSPSQFIESHRTLSGGFARVEIPVNTFQSHGGPSSPEPDLAGAGASLRGVKATSHSLSIPVYRGSDAPLSTYRPGTGTIRRIPESPTAVAQDVKPQPPTGIQTVDPEDFWSRVKSKLKNGTLDTGAPK